MARKKDGTETAIMEMTMTTLSPSLLWNVAAMMPQITPMMEPTTVPPTARMMVY